MDITGRLTANAAIRQAGEKQVVGFSVAVNETYRRKDGEKITLTDYFDCSFWLGTGIAPYLTKGTIVELSGRVSVRAWLYNGEAKAGLNFNVAKIKLHGGGVKANSENNIEVHEAQVIRDEATSNDEHDDLPF